ncbi:helix-turn-helix domain-containing protein [Candidatus Binatus sp.]|uniref:helix-turn-helix domain-containing protein n=1 Tax=Candidatus Binatus sp. TaxID=2811406 RepID=UPI00351D8526
MSLRASSPTAAYNASPPADWQREYIIAELHRRGISLRQLSFRNGYRRNTVREALDRVYPKAQSIIAAALGVKPNEIWPSRYQRKRRLLRGPVLRGQQ